VELVAIAGLLCIGDAGRATQQRRQYRVLATAARQHQVLVEWCLQGARVGHAEHSSGRLDVIGSAKARLGLARAGESVVQVAANAQVEGPVARLDLVLQVEAEFPDVGAPEG